VFYRTISAYTYPFRWGGPGMKHKRNQEKLNWLHEAEFFLTRFIIVFTRARHWTKLNQPTQTRNSYTQFNSIPSWIFLDLPNGTFKSNSNKAFLCFRSTTITHRRYIPLWALTFPDYFLPPFKTFFRHFAGLGRGQPVPMCPPTQDNTLQRNEDTSITLSRFGTRDPCVRAPMTHALNRSAMVIGKLCYILS
jgi:hypothetical protein